jgi:hypothetical protein
MGKDWSSKFVKDSSGKKIARISHKIISKPVYDARKLALGIKRVGGKFGHMRDDLVGGGFQLSVSGVLRKRKVNAKREGLSKIDTANPNYLKKSVTHKSHFIADTFGGPNNEHNLSNEESPINLSGHKIIENRIAKQMDQNFSGAGPLQRRGSMVVEGDFDHLEQSQTRTYHAHVDAGNGFAESFHHFTVKRI